MEDATSVLPFRSKSSKLTLTLSFSKPMNANVHCWTCCWGFRKTGATKLPFLEERSEVEVKVWSHAGKKERKKLLLRYYNRHFSKLVFFYSFSPFAKIATFRSNLQKRGSTYKLRCKSSQNQLFISLLGQLLTRTCHKGIFLLQLGPHFLQT